MVAAIEPRSKLANSRRGSARHPCRQGDLDGLCGVYAVINALRVVCPELTHKVTTQLFKRLVKCLRGRAREPLNVIVEGMGYRMLRHLLTVAINFVNRRLGTSVKARQLPKAVRAPKSIQRVWQGLTNVLSPQCTAIIGIHGRVWHWTVAHRISPDHLFLFDSDNMKRVSRAKCTTRDEVVDRYCICPHEVTLVERIANA